jgi:hypothetical protein
VSPRDDLALTLAEALKGRTEEDFLAATDAMLAAPTALGWRPPLSEPDVDSLRSRIAALINAHFGDDAEEASLAAAQQLIDEGFADKTGVMGPPEPVAATLRRVLRDLEYKALCLDPVPAIGQDPERRDAGIIGARTLREYADHLRQHPALMRGSSSDAAASNDTKDGSR